MLTGTISPKAGQVVQIGSGVVVVLVDEEVGVAVGCGGRANSVKMLQLSETTPTEGPRKVRTLVGGHVNAMVYLRSISLSALA